MVELVNPFNKSLSFSDVLGRWDVESARGLAQLGSEINRQSAMIGYLNAFGMFTAACACTVPLILLMRKRSAQPAAK
jgi:DHA2 family multidrug resistance protein